eukprot:m.21311 g.21311  ORF g.21311 m.21311 type:complete len:90 (+) comp5338_c0_seq1:2552-2821(+)
MFKSLFVSALNSCLCCLETSTSGDWEGGVDVVVVATSSSSPKLILDEWRSNPCECLAKKLCFFNADLRLSNDPNDRNIPPKAFYYMKGQ